MKFAKHLFDKATNRHGWIWHNSTGLYALTIGATDRPPADDEFIHQSERAAAAAFRGTKPKGISINAEADYQKATRRLKWMLDGLNDSDIESPPMPAATAQLRDAVMAYERRHGIDSRRWK